MMRKQLIVAALVLFLAAGWFPVAARAETASVSYIDENGVERTADNVTVLREGMTNLSAGWYAVTGILHASCPIKLNGAVHLILCDDAIFRVDGTIDVNGSTFIYGQRGGSGVLRTQGSKRNAGINVSGNYSLLTINGGIIKAIGGEYAAGIGVRISRPAGSVIINGGQVYARGGEGGAGIGGGYSENGGDVIIRGGSVNASSRKGGSAIGRGYNGSVDRTLKLGNMMVTDGEGTPEVPAQERENECRSVNVYLEPCELHHYSDDGACTYCGFREKESEPIPYAAPDGAILSCDEWTRIGADSSYLSGNNSWYAVQGTVTNEKRIEISGSVHLILCDGAVLDARKGIHVPPGASLTVWPQSGGSGMLSANGGTINAGIGGNEPEAGGTITIYGGTVTAYSRDGAGIGGGDDGAGGTITVNGGRIRASSKNGSGIGPGKDGDPGTVVLNWTNESDYISASSITAGTCTLEKRFRYRTAVSGGESRGEATAENLLGKDAGWVLFPFYKDDAGVSFPDGDQRMAVGVSRVLRPAVAEAGTGTGVWTWRSGDEAVATVSQTGEVTAVAVGMTQITAQYMSDTAAGEAGVTVTVVDAYTVTAAQTEHGAVTADPAAALPGAVVTMTAAPETGYRLGTLVVTCGGKEAETHETGEENVRSFTMPDGDVTVSAAFCEDQRYAITFLSWDGQKTVTLKRQELCPGQMPAYDAGGSDPLPTRAPTEQKTYTWTGWEPALRAADGDEVYYAQYSEATRSYPVRFLDWDGTELQENYEIPYGTMPEFYGEEPVRASDGNSVYRFLGWSPEFARVTGETVYQAQYDAVPILKTGENTVPVRPFEPVRCPFTPAVSGGYRFWSTGGNVNAVVDIYEGDSLIAGDHDWQGEMFNFDCAAELTAGHEYRVQITAFGCEEATVWVQSAAMHTVTLDNSDPHGTVFLEDDPESDSAAAYTGKLVSLVPALREGEDEDIWWLQEIVVTEDGSGLPVETEGSSFFRMPDADVTVTPVFSEMLLITVSAEEGIYAPYVFADGRGWEPERARAVSGARVETAFFCDEGVEIACVYVTGADGEAVAADVDYENEAEVTCVFTMPDTQVTVRVKRTDTAPDFEQPDFILPGDTRSIGESAFEGDESISVVEIPAGCSSIGRWAFRNCTDLWMVRVPAGCEIGEDAFLGCGEVYLYSTAGSPAETYCNAHDNCVFVEEAQA